MEPTRQEQAAAILDRTARALASRIIGRRAMSRADFTDAFNVEWIDIFTEIETHDRLMGLGRNRVGPHNGLYVLHDDDGTYRIFIQERGESVVEFTGLTFDEARHRIIDLVIQLQGLPFTPPGQP